MRTIPQFAPISIRRKFNLPKLTWSQYQLLKDVRDGKDALLISSTAATFGRPLRLSMVRAIEAMGLVEPVKPGSVLHQLSPLGLEVVQ